MKKRGHSFKNKEMFTNAGNSEYFQTKLPNSISIEDTYFSYSITFMWLWNLVNEQSDWWLKTSDIKFMRRPVGYTTFDHRRNDDISEEFQVDPLENISA